MKRLVVGPLIVLVSTIAHADNFEQSGCTSAQIEGAKKYLEVVEEKQRAGEVTMVEVGLAEFGVLETIYCSEKPQPYSVSCLDLKAKEQSVLDEVRKEMAVGRRSDKEYGLELSKAGKLFLFCSSEPF